MEETIANIRLRELLEARGGKCFTHKNGDCAYLMPNESVVRLPNGHARIPESVVRELAEIKCEMSPWEYDFWLTNQDKPKH